MIQADLQLRANHLRSGRTPYVLATVVRAERPTSAKAGDSALLLPDGTLEGFVGGTCAESTVRLEGLRLLETGESTLLRITPAADEREVVGDGLVTVGNPCLSGGTLEIFLEAMIPPTLVHVFGDAPIARALGRVGEALGYEIRAVGNPEEPFPADTAAVVVASHGRHEERVLTAAIRAGVPYVALVASRRRGHAVVAGLDLSEDEKARVHTPAGLDIGARAAPEIALSVLAEIIATRPQPARQVSVPSVLPAEAVDPVCGMTVAVTAASLRLEHNGRVWHFCGPGCRQAFADDPGRYLDE
ncbi:MULTISPECIES: XdhC family protein [unclassified Kribbella]|uniref:XdhC family protein n=1 Tax=unclassified Kribbella TaxID=2644121 RepID=UPI0033D1AAC8